MYIISGAPQTIPGAAKRSTAAPLQVAATCRLCFAIEPLRGQR
jgi:hypothetical protein